MRVRVCVCMCVLIIILSHDSLVLCPSSFIHCHLYVLAYPLVTLHVCVLEVSMSVCECYYI